MRGKTLLLGLLLLLTMLAVSCGVDSKVTEESVPDPTTLADSEDSDPTPSGPEFCEEILFIYSNIHSSRTGGENIYTICPGDSSPRSVTFGENFIRNPQWSPDRSQIAFLSYSTGSTQIHIIDRDGTNDHQLTSGSDLDAEGMVVRPDGDREIAELIWLPEGDRVAVALRGHEGLIWQAVDVATGEVTPLEDLVLPSSNYVRSMSLSHDGTRIAYTIPTNPEEIDSPVEIYIQELAGSTPYQLTNTGWEISNPVWSPDDSQIIFLSSTEYDSIQNAIYMINLDGSGLHEPILTGLNPDRIAWSPDGQSLAVIAGEAYATGDVFNPDGVVYTLNTLNIRTGERIILFKTESPNHIYHLSW